MASRKYDGESFRADLVAGVTTAAIVAPKAMASADLAGLPVQVGLYTALAPMLVYAALGTSRPLSVSTTATVAILAGSALSTASAQTGASPAVAAATLAVLVGAYLVGASALQLGFVTNFLSESVLAGFKTGTGFLIVVSMMAPMFGVHLPPGQSIIKDVAGFMTAGADWHWATIVLSLGTLALIGAVERFAHRIPAYLVAVVTGIALNYAVDMPALGITLVGQFPAGLPSLQLPYVSMVEYLWLPAFGVAVLIFTESIATVRSFAEPSDPPIRPDRELLAFGAANIASGFFGGMPASASASQTAINQASGARTQMSEVVTAAIVVLVLLFLSGFIGRMPKPVLDAIVVNATLGLIDFKPFREIAAVNSQEFWWAIVSAVCVVLFGILSGVLMGVIASFLGLIYITNQADIEVMAPDPTTGAILRVKPGQTADVGSGVVIARPQGVVYFGNSARLSARLAALCGEASRTVRCLILDAGTVPYLEFSGIKMLSELRDELAKDGVELMIANLQPRAHKSLRRSSLGKALGAAALSATVSDALADCRNRFPS
jgi:SulP family sulfate permease